MTKILFPDSGGMKNYPINDFGENLHAFEH
jgi:hypothetical protein